MPIFAIYEKVKNQNISADGCKKEKLIFGQRTAGFIKYHL